jgi:TPR repeat protein
MQYLARVIAFLLLATPAWAGAPCAKTDFKACKQKCAKKQPESCMRLGFLYMGIEKGADVTDDGKARAAMEFACSAKFGEACVYTGTMAEVGRGQAASVDVARSWWDKGCSFNHGGSCLKFATSVDEAGDKPRAARYYELACKFGEPDGCGVLGQMELLGKGIPAAPERGVKHLLQRHRVEQQRLARRAVAGETEVAEIVTIAT